MTISGFFGTYDLWTWAFNVINGVVVFILIRTGDWCLFLIRTRRRLKHLNVNCFLQRDQTNYPCKLWIDFRNWTNKTLLMRIEGYKVPRDIRPDPKATRDSTSGLLEIKFIENPSQSNNLPTIIRSAGSPPEINFNALPTLNVDSIIRDGENKRVWVPLDPSQSDDVLEKALKEGKIGKLKAEILWFADKPRFVRYRPKIRRV